MTTESNSGPADAIYARQSIDKADSISIESQIEFCKYETRGNPYKVFWDKGYSGKNTDRPGFQKMLHEIRYGNIGRVICYKLDRCSRSILDFASLIEEFQKHGVEFVSCTEKFDTSTPMGRAMLNICIVFAQLERETIQQRVADAYRSRSKKGFYMGGRIPFGFRLVPHELERKHTSRYEQNPMEAEIIRFLYTKYGQPGTSLADVVCSLNKDGIRNPRRSDGLWIRSHIGRMLSNPIYVKADSTIYDYYRNHNVKVCNIPEDFNGVNGCYLYNDKCSGQFLVVAPHPGIVDSQLWLSCQNKHTAKANSTCKDHHDTWIAGKIKCGCCEKNAVIKRTKKNSGKCYRYIVCPNSHGSQKFCVGFLGWKPEMVESIMSQLILNRLKAEFSNGSDSQIHKDHSQSPLSEKLSKLHKEIENLSDIRISSNGPELIQIQTQLQNLYLEKRSLLHQLNQHTQQKKPQLLPDYDDLWKKWSPEIHFQLLDAMVESVYLSNNKLRIQWKF